MMKNRAGLLALAVLVIAILLMVFFVMSEIAEVLEIPRGTVASRLRRARAEFRERVSALEGVAPGKREDERKPWA